MPFSWVDCCNWESVPDEHHHVIRDLLQSGKRFKKLKGRTTPTFRVKINYADRLIFCTKIIDKNPYIEVIEIVVGHNYKKPEALGQSSSALTELKAPAKEEDEEEDVFESEKMGARLYHHETFVELNPAQRGPSIDKIPLLLTAGPGGGKTLVGEALMQEAIQRCHAQGLEPRVAYVTQSAALAYEEQQGWGSTEAASFFSYAQFVLFHDPSIEHHAQVGIAEFNTWFINYLYSELETIKNKIKIAKNKTPLLAEQAFLRGVQHDISRLYEEMRAMPSQREVYGAYGARWSMFPIQNEYNPRSWLFETRRKYQDHLKENHQYDLVFHKFSPRFQYHFLFVDEVYDLSRLAWENLSKACINYQLCMAGDTHQRLDTPLSLRPALLQMLYNAAGHYEHEILPGSYRCSRQILEIVNVLIELKTRLRGGIADADECTHVSLEHAPDDERTAVYLHTLEEASIEEFQHLAASPQCVVITHERHFAEARARFNTPYVGTPAMLKGLEKDFVILYKFTDDDTDLFKKSNLLLQRLNHKASPQHRAARDESCLEFECIYNQMIVAVSRARKKLFIIDDHIFDCPSILNPLRQVIYKSASASASAASELPTDLTHSNEDWLKEARLLIKNEQTLHLAKAIYCGKLGYSEEDFEVFKSEQQSLQTRFLKPIQTAALNEQVEGQNKSPKKAAASPAAPMQRSPISVTKSMTPVSAGASEPLGTPTSMKKKKELSWSDASHYLLPALQANEKILDSLHFLYDNFSHENLTRWFNNKNRVFNFMSLFERPEVIVPCRFIDAILQSPTRRALFCQFLRSEGASVEGVRIFSLFQSKEHNVHLLHSAVIWKAQEYVQLCLDENVSLVDADDHMRTPLHLAFFYGRLWIARMLCSGIEPRHTKDAMRYQPTSNIVPTYHVYNLFSHGLVFFFQQAKYSTYEIIEKIYNKDPTLYTKLNQLQANELIEELAHHEEKEMLENKKSLTDAEQQKLLDKKRDMYSYYEGAVRIYQTFTPLMNAIMLHDMPIIKALVKDSNVNINQTIGENDVFALLLATECGFVDVVEVLLKENPDIDHHTQDGVTPLLLAAQLNFQAIARLLLRAGVDVNQSAYNTNLSESENEDEDENENEYITPLISAVAFQRPAILRDLLSYGAAYDDKILPLRLLLALKTPEIRKIFSIYKEQTNMATQLQNQISKEFIAAFADTSLIAWRQSIELLMIKDDHVQCLFEQILNNKDDTRHFISAIKKSVSIKDALGVLYANFNCDFGFSSMLHIAARAKQGNLFLLFCAQHYPKLEFPEEHMTYSTDPIWDAVEYSNLQTFDILLRCDTQRVNLLSPAGHTLLKQTLMLKKTAESNELVQRLLGLPEIITRIKNYLETAALCYAVNSKNLEVLNAFLTHLGTGKIYFDFSEEAEKTSLLLMLVKRKFIAGLQAILQYHINIEDIDELEGFTAVMWAVRLGSQEMFDLLVTHGAKLDCVSHTGQNIPKIAQEAKISEDFYMHIFCTYNDYRRVNINPLTLPDAAMSALHIHSLTAWPDEVRSRSNEAAAEDSSWGAQLD